MAMKSAGIVGTGLYLPEEIRTNEWFNDFNLLSVGDIFDSAGVQETPSRSHAPRGNAA